jgi:hypothetical protein
MEYFKKFESRRPAAAASSIVIADDALQAFLGGAVPPWRATIIAVQHFIWADLHTPNHGRKRCHYSAAHSLCALRPCPLFCQSVRGRTNNYCHAPSSSDLPHHPPHADPLLPAARARRLSSQSPRLQANNTQPATPSTRLTKISSPPRCQTRRWRLQRALRWLPLLLLRQGGHAVLASGRSANSSLRLGRDCSEARNRLTAIRGRSRTVTAPR